MDMEKYRSFRKLKLRRIGTWKWYKRMEILAIGFDAGYEYARKEFIQDCKPKQEV